MNIEVPKVLDNKENEILGNKKITTKRPDVEGKMIFQIVDLFGKCDRFNEIKSYIWHTSPKGFAAKINCLNLILLRQLLTASFSSIY